MIKYNQLDIVGDYLIIDIEIEDYPWYNGVYLEDIYIATKPNPNIDEGDVIMTLEEGESLEGSSNKRKRAQFFIPSIKNKLVYIIPVPINLETIPANSPCGADVINIGATYNKRLRIDKGLAYLKEVGDTCNISNGFIDFILKQKALDFAISTCNFSTAEKYFKSLTLSKATGNGCGCYTK